MTHVPYPNTFRHPFSGEQSDAETVSRACLDWIEKRLFLTTTPPEEVAAIVVDPENVCAPEYLNRFTLLQS